ncbi:MAG TPA: 4Fe-4S binding protein [Deltaproteobacteria bacterium]|nr:4Fe-4S binding protein [Deltaproteobacteria bacterium]
MLQKVRRSVQLAIFLSVAAVAFVSNYGVILSMKSQRDFTEVATEDSGVVLAWLYTALHRVVDPPFNPVETLPTLDRYKGGVWSLSILGVDLTDPLAGLVVMLASLDFHWRLLAAMALPLLFIVVFGRAFCGWICPMGTLLELVDDLRRYLSRALGLELPDYRIHGGYRYFVLAGGVAAALFGGTALLFLLPYGPVSFEIFHLIFFGGFSFLVFFIVFFIAVDLVSRRGWCRYLCPAGAFFSLLSPLRLLRVRRVAEGCPPGCEICTEECTMALEPHRDRIGTGCDNCGSCISACPAKTINYRIGTVGGGK